MEINVKISDLKKMVDDLLKGGFEFVEITYLEGDDESPDCLNFVAYDGEGGGVDFDYVDAVEVDVDYKLK